MMWRYAIITACAALLSSATFAEDGYRAAYKLVVGPLTVGEAERSFEIEPSGAYRFVSKMKSTGVVSIVRDEELLETSSGMFRDGIYYPADYTYVRKSKKKPRNIAMHFDRDNANIETIVNGEILWAPLREDLLDKLVYQAALMHDLGVGKTELIYRIADRGREKLYQPVFADEEVIKTKAGRFNTIKIVRERTNDKRRTIFWCAPELGYLPVRIAVRDKKGKETTANLTEYHSLVTRAPSSP